MSAQKYYSIPIAAENSVSLFVCSNTLTFSTLRHFWVGTVKKSTLYKKPNFVMIRSLNLHPSGVSGK